ncbi:BLUF domain-containing protein [Vannielia litorea]|uniref:Sensors of blue-light using FAD n=1 Tax=Vannielia litorea TaxID=1217970 RepID=A0A1N6GLD4_9RHOB|nr:BLUF domain-containing protein [Vannielia litorea]SIO08301.1 Sensors of blue-light using FAD [Vannielia litorea]
MHQLLYRSIARDEEFGDSDLDILLQALDFNANNGITGHLWRGRGQFFQALHGPRVVVLPLMERISADTRHSDVEVLISEDGDAPSPFAEWAMGYDYVAEDELGISLETDGSRPMIPPAKAREIWNAMIEQSRSEAEWGGSSPYGRKPSEPVDSWVKRLKAARGL